MPPQGDTCLYVRVSCPAVPCMSLGSVQLELTFFTLAQSCEHSL